MATIIKTLDTKKNYILLGSGYGMYHSERPHWLMGDYEPDTKSGRAKAVCACDQHGKVIWLRSDSIQVISIDGKKPEEYFDSLD